jgi:hypothetical protein
VTRTPQCRCLVDMSPSSPSRSCRKAARGPSSAPTAPRRLWRRIASSCLSRCANLFWLRKTANLLVHASPHVPCCTSPITYVSLYYKHIRPDKHVVSSVLLICAVASSSVLLKSLPLWRFKEFESLGAREDCLGLSHLMVLQPCRLSTG